MLVQPKQGGQRCNAATESRPCNSGSCTRNCKLRKWSKWALCSVACGGGFQERYKRVPRPIRGQGKCLKKKPPLLYGYKKCNTHQCVGDEVCIAKQDLIMAIDSSGSPREKGLETIYAPMRASSSPRRGCARSSCTGRDREVRDSQGKDGTERDAEAEIDPAVRDSVREMLMCYLETGTELLDDSTF